MIFLDDNFLNCLEKRFYFRVMVEFFNEFLWLWMINFFRWDILDFFKLILRLIRVK